MKYIHTLHPFSLFFYFSVMLAFTMFFVHPVLLFQALIAGICFQTVLEAGFSRSSVFFYILLTLVSGIVNPFITHNGATILFYMNGRIITLEAFVYGLLMGIMLSAALVWFRCLSIVMTRDKLLCLFHHIPKLAMILTMAFRFVPLFRKKYESIKAAQTVMGNVRTDTYQNQVKDAMSICSILITWSLENGMDTADSMKARGYGIPGRSEFSLFRFRRRDALFTTVTIVAAGIVLKGIAAGTLHFTCYPQIIFSNQGNKTLLSYIAHGLLAFLPVLIEIKEAVKWKFYKLKI